MNFLDKVVGLYHFIWDRTPRNIPLVEPQPRAVNHWSKDGRALVAKATATGDLRSSVERAIGLLGKLGQLISPVDRVLVKPNFNSPDPFPGSTDLDFLQVVLELLLELGAKVTVGESSGGIWRPTKKVMQKLNAFELTRRLGVELVAFEEQDDWVRVNIRGDYLGSVTVPRIAYEADKLIYLPCMKTHNLARFSGALKLAVGLMHPGERRALHARHLEEKVAEISLFRQPDLIIMDGRKAFVSGGPDKGELVEPGILLASGDLVATDVEAMKVLLTYKARNKLLADPWRSPQIVTASRHNLGAVGNYLVVSET